MTSHGNIFTGKAEDSERQLKTRSDNDRRREKDKKRRWSTHTKMEQMIMANRKKL